MRRYFCIIVLSFFTIKLSAQDLFPDRIKGNWTGVMYIWKNGSLQDSVKVNLNVKSIGNDLWQWKMDYKSVLHPITKDYQIRVKDRDKQLFITDEGEGIELEDYSIGNIMMSMFETDNLWLTSTQEITGEKLIFQVTAGRKSNVTGQHIQNYSVISLQKVILTRSSELK